MVGASLKFQSSARIRESLSTGGKDTGSSGISGQVDATNMSSGTVLGHLKLHNINVKIEIFFCFNCLCLSWFQYMTSRPCDVFHTGPL